MSSNPSPSPSLSNDRTTRAIRLGRLATAGPLARPGAGRPAQSRAVQARGAKAPAVPSAAAPPATATPGDGAAQAPRPGATPRQVKVAVVASDPLLRTLIRDAISADRALLVTVTAAGAETARKDIEPGRADVAIIDVDLADGNGLALAVSLQRADPRLRVILLADPTNLGFALQLRHGQPRRWSVMAKHTIESGEWLARAVIAVAAGSTVTNLGEADDSPSPNHLADVLTDAQMQVLRLSAQGLSTGRVAELLGLAPKSVENHLHAVYRVLGVQSKDLSPRVAAVVEYLKWENRG
ncbi:MAG: response regulator transcription factor [Bifidobacteriaceae bacterium]|jgi:DNA-binding NarL/FixJ family response regulator|nr:response regulator transcription factor [Bifidobacteriaceae bacterium]